MIELGGNIFLEGFDELDSAEILIIKKLVGSYVRSMCYHAECEKAIITLKKGSPYTISVQAITPKATLEQSAQRENVFMAIDAALKNVLKAMHIRA